MLYRLNNGWMAVTQHIDGDAGHKIQVDFAIAIPYAGAFAAYQCQRLSLKGTLIILMLQCDPISLTRRCHAVLLLCNSGINSFIPMLTGVECILVDVTMSEVAAPCRCFAIAQVQVN